MLVCALQMDTVNFQNLLSLVLSAPFSFLLLSTTSTMFPDTSLSSACKRIIASELNSCWGNCCWGLQAVRTPKISEPETTCCEQKVVQKVQQACFAHFLNSYSVRSRPSLLPGNHIYIRLAVQLLFVVLLKVSTAPYWCYRHLSSTCFRLLFL